MAPSTTSRMDGLGRVLESLSGLSQTGRTWLSPSPTLDRGDIDARLLQDWHARREIVQPMRDLVRKGFELEGLPDWVDVNAVKSAVEGDPRKRKTEGHAGMLSALGEWWGVGVGYGGAVLLPVVEDGLQPWEPLDLNRVQTILSWEVLDRGEITPFRRTVGGPVEYWLLCTNREVITSPRQIVHPSRVLPHWGEWMPARWRSAFGGWGASRLELLERERSGLATASTSFSSFLDRFHQDVVALGELQELLDAEGGEEALAQQLATMLKARRTLGCMILDNGKDVDARRDEPARRGDQFYSAARPTSGAPEVATWMHSSWRMGSAMPEVVADGTATGGLNSGEEAAQWRAWDGVIEAIQEGELTPAAVWCLDLVFAAKDGPTKGKAVDEYTVQWNRLSSDDPKELAEIGKLWSEADANYRDMGTLTGTEIRKSRHVDGLAGPVRVESEEILPDASESDVQGEIASQAASELLGAAGDVQAQALNGAQIDAFRELAMSVANGEMPASVAEWLVSIAVPGIDLGRVRTAFATAEAFEPERPEPPPNLPPRPAGVAVAAQLADAFGLDLQRTRMDHGEILPNGDRGLAAVWLEAITRLALAGAGENPRPESERVAELERRLAMLEQMLQRETMPMPMSGEMAG